MVAQDYQLPYTLSQPTQTILVPPMLEEISGIALSKDESYFLAVQDEKGLVFEVDKKTGEVISNFTFWKDGDYEDIERVGEKIYVLKNTGTIYEILQPNTENQSVNKYNIHLTDENDAEGLAYDAKQHCLLIACKKSVGDQLKKQIYAFDLNTKTSSEKPVWEIDANEVMSFLEVHPALKKWNKLVEFFNPAEAPLSFSPSAIAFHPLTNDIYVLSAVGNVLIILNPKGQVQHIEKLSKKIHYQPEGICFEKDGTLYISNEGKDNVKGRILRFEMKG